MANRKGAEEYILKWIEKLLPGSENTALYEALFKSMSDKEFDAYIKGFKDQSTLLAVIVPHGGVEMSVERNIKLAKELGISFFKRIWIPEGESGEYYLTPTKNMVIHQTMRRASQLLTKKLSVSEGGAAFDALTGQTTAQGAALSYPEVQMLSAIGLDATLTELLKYRGGDRGGLAAMNTLLSKQGAVSLNALAPYATGVKSVQSLKTYLTAMHFRNTL